ncbi:MAG: condensation domain-containing protein, partial [Synechococcaceae cyanobacterium]
MVPSAFIALEALPLTANGKLDRKALPAPSFAGDLQQRIPPSSDHARQLHRLWADVLGHCDFVIADNFLMVGGHSLSAARLVARIEQAFGTAPPLATLFQSPTIAGLLPLLAPHQGRSEPTAARQPIPTAAPLAGDWPPGCQAFQASFAQARLWFLQQLQPELTAYHIPIFWRCRGELDLQALQQALTALIARHPTLRTSFQLQGQDVVQILHPPATFSIDLEHLQGREAQDVIAKWLQQEAESPFDLSSGQLLRIRLLHVAPDEHLLLINHHHIASDGWSLSILHRDLVELYNAAHTGRPVSLKPLKVHYQDYADWQRNRLSDERLRRLNDYWAEQLADLEPLELPADYPRPSTPSHRGQTLRFAMEPALLLPFEELCRYQGATLQMGLLALLALLLHRTSRQDDFAIGVPIWGRNHPDLEPLIGFFVNTLPVRTRFSPQLSFRQFLDQVKTTSIAAYDHQELPFEQMVEALHVERDTSRNPLVQVMLQLLDLPELSQRDLDGLQLEELPWQWDSAKFDLSLFFRRSTDQGLEGWITYATDLFTADRIERLSAQLLCLLQSLLEAPDAMASGLNLLPNHERQQIERWQQGPSLMPPDLCLHEQFEQQARQTPDAVALVFENRQFSYQQLNVASHRLAQHLQDQGLKTEHIVAVCLPRSPELLVAMLAVFKAGGCFTPIDPLWPPSRREALLEQLDEPWLWQAADMPAPKLNSQQQLRMVALQPDISLEDHGENNPIIEASRPKVAINQAAYQFFTSGSTGLPKAVVVEHQALASRIASLSEIFDLKPGIRVLAHTTVVFDISLLELMIPLCHGATVVLASAEQSRHADALIQLIKNQKIERLQATPTLFQMLKAAGFAPSKQLTILVGGEALPPSLAADLCQPGTTVRNVYGPTEATIWATFAAIKPGQAITIGQPLPGTAMRVLDHNGQPCPIGIPGELHIGGAGLARGYLNNPQLTAEKFIPDPYSLHP